jgi:hypothetical protein
MGCDGVEIKVKGSGQECPPHTGPLHTGPLHTGLLYACPFYTGFFLGRRLNRWKPQALAASRAPKRITASMLERPWGDQ